MAFAEQGHRPDGASLSILYHQVLGGPAGAGHGAAAFLERQQEFVPQERLCRTRQRIPARRVDLRDAVEKPGTIRGHACATRGLATEPASIRSRYLSASSAAMQPVP